MNKPRSLPDTVIAAVKMILKTYKAAPIAPEDCEELVRTALTAGIEDLEEWEGLVRYLYAQLVLRNRLSVLSNACDQHRGPGLRRARVLGREARRMIRESVESAVEVEDVEMLEAEHQALVA